MEIDDLVLGVEVLVGGPASAVSVSVLEPGTGLQTGDRRGGTDLVFLLLKSQGKMFWELAEDLTRRHDGHVVWFVPS